MAKLVKCKSCGADIAKTAKTCPQCGAKQHQAVLSVCAVIVVITFILILAVAFGGSDDEPKPVRNGSGTETMEPSESDTPEKNTFGPGESAELKDVIVTLNGVTESSGSQFNKPSDGNVFLLCEFTIENNSEKDIGVSSLVSFEAYVDDFAKNMSLSALMEKGDKSQLDGTVAAGKKMNGVVGYEAPADYKNIEIRFTPDFWNGKDIKFVYEK